MNNNDVIRKIRYTFNYSDSKMMSIFEQVDHSVTRAQLSNWLKKDDDPENEKIYDKYLVLFLNGLIIDKRGKREGEQPVPEKSLNNNIIFRKLKIALNLKSEDILEILQLADMRISKHELSAFFRKPTQSQYRLCKDQFLRNFLYGLQLRYHPKK